MHDVFDARVRRPSVTISDFENDDRVYCLVVQRLTLGAANAEPFIQKESLGYTELLKRILNTENPPSFVQPASQALECAQGRTARRCQAPIPWLWYL
jgi:hypothetical protein